jgi:hypothetical protein
MTTLNGIFSLRSPRDLVAKLEADYGRLCGARVASIQAQYAAFDFCVTARYLPEWARITGLSPSPGSDAEIIDHIADGAKHFHITNPRHVSVDDTLVPDPLINEDTMDVYANPLVVILADGRTISVLQLAQRVLEHWKREVP